MLPSRVIIVSIACAPASAYAYIRDARHLPHWARGLCTAVTPDAEGWILMTPGGPAKLRFAAPNEFGVLDHYVCVGPDMEVFVPLRVLPNGAGTDVQLTLFRQPGMTDEQFDKDDMQVRQDLAVLKSLLES